ncbi:MAG: triphosphoribosyl-dephospho-CoA synthase [Eubacteriales bacterium]|nr:triphosphoribosyl-dephospho-CoA synthase [Eubacteriales bacterium]
MSNYGGNSALYATFPAVDTPQVLEQRERQVAKRQAFLRPGYVYLDFSLNLPGPYKRSYLSDRFFEDSERHLADLLAKAGFERARDFSLSSEAGLYRCWELFTTKSFNNKLNLDAAAELKSFTTTWEENFPAARLWDLDVYAEDGIKLSRPGQSRPCLICSEPAWVCARSRRHSWQELLAASEQLMREYYWTSYKELLLKAARQAALTELELTPKPGLVDMVNNGAHHDMDYDSFQRSLTALEPYFARYLEITEDFLRQELVVGRERDTAEQDDPLDLRPLFERLQRTGQEAEVAALAANQGVNCHLGLNFALALLLPAALMAFDQNLTDFAQNGCWQQPSAEQIACLASDLVAESYLSWRSEQPEAAGGARESAFAAYPLILKGSLPLLRSVLAERDPSTNGDYALSLALLYLMAHNHDSNLLRRGGKEGLLYTQREAGRILERARRPGSQSALTRDLIRFDQELIARNLSPGGSADLLALTVFLKLIS